MAILRKLVLGCFVLLAGTLCAAGEGTVKAVRPAGVPEAADAWVVLPAIGQTVTRMKKLAESFVPGTGPALELSIRGMMAARGLDNLDDGKPALVVFSLGQQPGLAMAGLVREGADPLKSLEDRLGKAARGEGDVRTFLQVQGGNLPDKEFHVMLKAGRLVLGDDLKLVQALAAAPAPGAFAGETDLLAGVDLKKLAELRKADIDAFIKQMEAGPELPAAAAGGLDEATRQAIGKSGAAVVRDVLANTELLCSELRMGEKEITTAWGLKATAGGALASAIEKLAGARPASFKAPAGSAVLALAADISPEVSTKLMEMARPFFAAMVQAEQDKERAAKLDEMFTASGKILAAADGRVCQVMSSRAGGLSVSYRAGLKDERAAREAVIAALKLMTSPELAKGFAGMGFKYTLTEKARKSGALDVDRLTAEMTAAADQPNPGAMMMQIVYGNPMVHEMAFTGKAVFGAMGKEADKALDEMIAAEGGAGREYLADALKRAPAGSFVVGELSLVEYAKMAMGMMAAAGAPVPAPDLGAAPDEPVTAWMTAGGGQLGYTANVPVAPIRRIFQAWQQAMQQMMQNQPMPMPPPPPPPGGDDAEQF